MAQNIDRRYFLQGALASAALAALSPGEALGIGPGSLFRIATLKHGGRWDVRPDGLRKMLQEVEKRTSIRVDSQAVNVSIDDKKNLFSCPLVFWTGEGDVPPLSERSLNNLALYLRAGGTLVVDSPETTSESPFMRAARREIARIYPNKAPQKIPSSHVLYKSFYLVKDPVGRVASASSMDAIFGEDRAEVIFSRNDLLGAWSRDKLGNYTYDVFPGGERQRELSIRLGINLVMYSLCLDYKEDQVHVPFILRRRNWKID